jgi:hypothetical protein
MNKEKIKVIAMDLDGTLTQHKQPMAPRTRETLVALSKQYKLLMVGAGQVYRIFNQMEQFPIDIIGNYGMQYGVYDPEHQSIRLVRDLSLPCDAPCQRDGEKSPGGSSLNLRDDKIRNLIAVPPGLLLSQPLSCTQEST